MFNYDAKLSLIYKSNFYFSNPVYIYIYIEYIEDFLNRFKVNFYLKLIYLVRF